MKTVTDVTSKHGCTSAVWGTPM